LQSRLKRPSTKVGKSRLATSFIGQPEDDCKGEGERKKTPRKTWNGVDPKGGRGGSPKVCWRGGMNAKG